jgi:G3E family GTPase
MITKLDIAPAEMVQGVHAALDELNDEAERASFPTGEQGTHALVPWMLATRKARSRKLEPHSHRHGQVSAATFTEDAPLLADPLVNLIEAMGDALLRVKGFVHLAGEPRRAFLELAGGRVSLRYDELWGDDAPRTELVLIGEDVDEAAIRRRLWACRARA